MFDCGVLHSWYYLLIILCGLSGIAEYGHLHLIFLENNNTEKDSLEDEIFKLTLKKLQDKGTRIKFDY